MLLCSRSILKFALCRIALIAFLLSPTPWSLLRTWAQGATAVVAHALPMQTPEAESVGTSTNLQAAAKVLLTKFDEVRKSKQDRISVSDLRAMAETGDPAVQEAARFFAVSSVDQHLAGDAGGLTREGLARCVAMPTGAEVAESLQGRGVAGARPAVTAQRAFLAVLLRDPGVPATARAALVGQLSDAEMLEIVGRPNAQGSAQDVADVTANFVYLARLSWLGTAEAEAISAYKVPYVMVRGAKDHSASYWDGHQVQLSEKMVTGGTGQVSPAVLQMHIGTFAHESGHAIFAFSGLSKSLNDDIARHHLTAGMGGILNEAIAGILQNRASVAALGYGKNKDAAANLVLAHDVEKNIANDQGFYAKYYHVNTAAARAQMGDIRQVLADVVVPYFQTRFLLLGDPQLAETLPVRTM